jgi:hypothetical protein
MTTEGLLVLATFSGPVVAAIVGSVVVYFLTRIKQTGEATHKIVNNQRTVMLRLVAALSRRVADDNPSDAAAQEAARLAESDTAQSNQ